MSEAMIEFHIRHSMNLACVTVICKDLGLHNNHRRRAADDAVCIRSFDVIKFHQKVQPVSERCMCPLT